MNEKNNRVCAGLCAVLSLFGGCVDAKAKSNQNLVKINSKNMKFEDVKTKDIKTKDIKTEDIKTKDVKKPKKSESSIKKLYEWVMNNKKKSLLFGNIATHVGWRGLNELRLLAIYKKLDEHYSHGGYSSSVERYAYRFKNKEGEQSLVIKSIPYLSIKKIAFLNEKFACQVIPALAKENEHLAEILDYHYGLGLNYVVYKDVGPNFDWPKKMLDENWTDKQKFERLRDVIIQMIDIMLWLCEKGYVHGDFKFDNLSVVNKDGKPFVRVFDYGLFQAPAQLTVLWFAELKNFSLAALKLSAWWLLGEKVPVVDRNYMDVILAESGDKKAQEKLYRINKGVSDLLNKLISKYMDNVLIRLLCSFFIELKNIYQTFCRLLTDAKHFKLELDNFKTKLQNLKF